MSTWNPLSQHCVLANMLFCHQMYYIFMINALLSRNCVVPIYALFPPIFLCSKVDHRQFVRFLDVWGRRLLTRNVLFPLSLETVPQSCRIVVDRPTQLICISDIYLLKPNTKGRRHIKRIDFFRALPEKGGALPEFLDPFFHHVVPYKLTSISCYVILFGHL